MEVKNSVKEFRQKKGESQVELADALSVSRQTIIAIEKGNYTPSVFLALKIAKHFKTNLENIFSI